MTDRWYFARPYTEFGPFTAAQLKELAAAGQIQPQDVVWKEGTEKKVPALKVRDLFATGRANQQPDAGPGKGRPGDPPLLPLPAAPADADLPPLPGPEPDAAPEDPANYEDFELAPGEPAPWSPAAAEPAEVESAPAAAPAQQPKKKRVISVKGGVISSQDGEVMRLRKKCLRCGYQDTSLTTIRIRSGITAMTFFCPKCKKSQHGEVQGVG